ncbi:hypothetical protein CDL15_Pgr011734 [Punica granatum]|uniref:Uncharacterized protein n=1 Tax=Punica granatum TaxID=22663 RepID=A0A218XFN5_PUNGR|nr:hypothetical protein CDL15_Pgr011734 [Punica granatum]
MDSHLFAGYACHRCCRQTFQTQRAESKEPCTQSYKSLEQSEIDSAVSLWIFVQNSLITESFRASWLKLVHA